MDYSDLFGGIVDKVSGTLANNSAFAPSPRDQQELHCAGIMTARLSRTGRAGDETADTNYKHCSDSFLHLFSDLNLC
jgi:hypothetical protein